jgi:hypothetical protein
VEAALSVAAAFAAMLAIAAAGLLLLGAGSITSLGSASAALVSMAVGGSLSLSSAGSSGSMFSLGMAGSVNAMPLGVTLAGTAALGLAFYLPLRRWRRLSPGLMAGRIAMAAATCGLLLVVLSDVGKGSVSLPSSVSSQLGGGLGGSSSLGILGRLRSLGGGGGTGPLSDVTFSVSGAVLGGLSWLLIVLLAGLLTAQLAAVPAGMARNRLRAMVGPTLSASIRVMTALLLVIGAFAVGAGLVLGEGHGPKVVGAVLLLLPNLLVAAVSAGAGVPWSLSAGPSSTGGSGLGGILGMLGSLGGGGGHIRSVHRSINIFGSPRELPLLLVAVGILLACAMLAAARTPVPTQRDGTPTEGRWERARRQAIVFGLMWGAGLAFLVLCSRLSGTMQVSIMGTPITGFGAHAGANVTIAAFAGFLAGGVAGGAGSLLIDAVRRRSGRGAA